MKKHLILAVAALIPIGCSEQESTGVATDREQEVSSRDSRLEAKEPGSFRFERDSFYPVELSSESFFDFAALIKSNGDSVDISVKREKSYRVRVILNPGHPEEHKKVIHDQTITADSETLRIGLFCSLAYTVVDNVIKVDPKKELLTLEVSGKNFIKEVPEWSYRPSSFLSRTVYPSEDEEAFFVLYHINNMGPNSFDMAVDSAYRTYETVVATIQDVTNMANKPEMATPSKPSD